MEDTQGMMNIINKARVEDLEYLTEKIEGGMRMEELKLLIKNFKELIEDKIIEDGK